MFYQVSAWALKISEWSIMGDGLKHKLCNSLDDIHAECSQISALLNIINIPLEVLCIDVSVGLICLGHYHFFSLHWYLFHQYFIHSEQHSSHIREIIMRISNILLGIGENLSIYSSQCIKLGILKFPDEDLRLQ